MFTKGASNYASEYIHVSRKHSWWLCALLPRLARWFVFVILPYQFLCCSSSTSWCHHLYWTGRKCHVRHLDTTTGTSHWLQGTNEYIHRSHHAFSLRCHTDRYDTDSYKSKSPHPFWFLRFNYETELRDHLVLFILLSSLY